MLHDMYILFDFIILEVVYLRKNNGARALKRQMPYHLMLMPAIIVVLIYYYMPMFGIAMAFQKFNPALGFLRSKWVGLKNFKYVFNMPDFYQVLWNTIYIAVLKIFIGIAVPLILALLINEVSKKWFKKVVQTSIFAPFFLSWVIMGGIIIELFSLEGPINSFVRFLGFEPVMFLMNNAWFPIVLVATDVWKCMGYNMIIYLAAITNIDPSLYEAAEVDGAGKWRQLLNITLPGILPILILIGTLSIGSILNAGFEQVLVLYNPIVFESGDILDTFVYRMGILERQYSPAAAVGLFKSAVSFILVSSSYFLAYKFSDYRIF